MRITSEFETQIKLGQVSMLSIKLDFNGRDDITRFLLGMQHISQQTEAMNTIYALLKDKIQPSHLDRRVCRFGVLLCLARSDKYLMETIPVCVI
ncbi:MAG: hypothetical protein AB8B66_05180 [Rickettsiaceae bacterium]